MQMFFDFGHSHSKRYYIFEPKQIELYVNSTLCSQVTFNDQKLVINGDLCEVELFGGNPAKTFRILLIKYFTNFSNANQVKSCIKSD